MLFIKKQAKANVKNTMLPSLLRKIFPVCFYKKLCARFKNNFTVAVDFFKPRKYLMWLNRVIITGCNGSNISNKNVTIKY